MKIEYDPWMREAENYIANGEDEIISAMNRKSKFKYFNKYSRATERAIKQQLEDLSLLPA